MKAMIKNKLKLLMFITTLSFSHNAFSGVLYCSETNLGGFKFKKGKYSLARFNPIRFKVNLNKLNRTISMEKKNYSCKEEDKNIFSCHLDYSTFNLNSKNGKFIKFEGIANLTKYGNDDITVSYGTCVEF